MRIIIGLIMFLFLINTASAIDIVNPVNFKIAEGTYIRVLSPQSALYFNVTENPSLLSINFGQSQLLLTSSANITVSNIVRSNFDDTYTFTVSGNGNFIIRPKMNTQFQTYTLTVNNAVQGTNNADVEGFVYFTYFLNGGTYNIDIRFIQPPPPSTGGSTSGSAISYGELPIPLTTPNILVKETLNAVDEGKAFLDKYSSAIILSASIIIITAGFFVYYPEFYSNIPSLSSRNLRRKTIIKRYYR